MDTRERDAIEEIRIMGVLKASPGWKMLLDWIQEQSDRRIAEILQPETPGEFMKGEVAAFQTLRAYPDMVISAAQVPIDAFAKVKEKEPADG